MSEKGGSFFWEGMQKNPEKSGKGIDNIPGFYFARALSIFSV